MDVARIFSDSYLLEKPISTFTCRCVHSFCEPQIDLCSADRTDGENDRRQTAHISVSVSVMLAEFVVGVDAGA